MMRRSVRALRLETPNQKRKERPLYKLYRAIFTHLIAVVAALGLRTFHTEPATAFFAALLASVAIHVIQEVLFSIKDATGNNAWRAAGLTAMASLLMVNTCWHALAVTERYGYSPILPTVALTLMSAVFIFAVAMTAMETIGTVDPAPVTLLYGIQGVTIVLALLIPNPIVATAVFFAGFISVGILGQKLTAHD